MKKQIIAAAVAATVSSVALADIAITGDAKVNYTYTDKEGTTPDTNVFKQEMSLKVVGKNGDTEVVMGFGGGALDNTAGVNTSGTGTMNAEDVYLTTKVGDVSIKTGTWDNGNNSLRASSRLKGKFTASTTVGGLDLTYNAADDANAESVKVGGTFGPVKASFEQGYTTDTTSVSASMNGVNVAYLGYDVDGANENREYYEISGEIAGIGVKYGVANADSSASIEGDSWMGDFEAASTAYDLDDGNDVTAIELKTSLAGNAVTYRNVQVDDDDASVTKDVSINKIIVTRPLASGATFEFTYTDTDSDVATEDTTGFDLELAVKF
jgi:hypothetical protein